MMYQDERQRLTAQIEEWNSNRLDLFALSQPNEVTVVVTCFWRKTCWWFWAHGRLAGSGSG